MNDLQILRNQDVADLLGVSKQTVWRLYKSGELPPKVQISGRANGWTWGTIREFIEERTPEPKTTTA